MIYLLYRPNRSPITSSRGRSRNCSTEVMMDQPPLPLKYSRFQESYRRLLPIQISHWIQSIFGVVRLYHPSMLSLSVLHELHHRFERGLMSLFPDSSLYPTTDPHSFLRVLYIVVAYSPFLPF